MNPAAATLRTLKGWGLAVVDFLYPPVCPLCWRRLEPGDDTVCFACRAELALRPDWRCPRCGAAGLGDGPRAGARCRLCPPAGSSWVGALSVSTYHDHTQRCVQLFKYHGRMELGELMARMMVESLEEPLLELQNRIDWVTPVPLHWTRRLTRGFNQSDLLARALAGAYKLRYQPKLLKRKRRTKRQALVPKERRAKNVEGAFALNRPGKIELRDAGILLVDDVITSGHTIEECAKVLKAAGAKEVWVASFARAGMDRAGDEE